MMGRTGDRIQDLEKRIEELESKVERLWTNFEYERSAKDFENSVGLGKQ